MRGRKPQPQSAKRAKGETRPSRSTVTIVEFPKVELMPAPPAWMNDDGKMMWNETGPLLISQRVLTRPDLYAFGELCFIYGELCDKHRRGVDPIAAERAIFARFCGDLGLNPINRVRVGGGGTAPDNPFLKHRRGPPSNRKP